MLLTNVHNEQVNNATAATDRETEALNVREGARAAETEGERVEKGREREGKQERERVSKRE